MTCRQPVCTNPFQAVSEGFPLEDWSTSLNLRSSREIGSVNKSMEITVSLIVDSLISFTMHALNECSVSVMHKI